MRNLKNTNPQACACNTACYVQRVEARVRRDSTAAIAFNYRPYGRPRFNHYRGLPRIAA